MLEVSAPGKIHLIGEHSVVYGYPAIISAIDKRTKIKVEKADKIHPVKSRKAGVPLSAGQFNRVKIKNNIYKKEAEFGVEEALITAKKSQELWQEGNKKNDFSELFEFLKSDFWKRNQAMLGLILERFKIKNGVSLIIDSELPIGVGLGSSASLSVAITKAIAELHNIQLPNQKINELSFELEKLNHGRPSGGDNSACTFGGTIWFEKGKIEKISLPDFLKNLIIVLTSRKKLNTGYFVQKVRNLEPNFRDSIMENLGKIAFEMRQGLRDENLEEIKNLINFAQDNLAKLGISTPEIEEIVKEVRKIGGAAKISGAGAGTLICFHRDKKRLTKLLMKLKVHPVKCPVKLPSALFNRAIPLGAELFNRVNFQEIKLGAEGVKIET